MYPELNMCQQLHSSEICKVRVGLFLGTYYKLMSLCQLLLPFLLLSFQSFPSFLPFSPSPFLLLVFSSMSSPPLQFSLLYSENPQRREIPELFFLWAVTNILERILQDLLHKKPPQTLYFKVKKSKSNQLRCFLCISDSLREGFGAPSHRTCSKAGCQPDLLEMQGLCGLLLYH